MNCFCKLPPPRAIFAQDMTGTGVRAFTGDPVIRSGQGFRFQIAVLPFGAVRG